ncbi:dTDP-4-dehydrorhamnose reductase [uncultured Desulfobacterium sp.]|uniref:dTDP-4-dehydrorhamnose reductase n=1 Tax=uncultured Desulfobacterium sp. TaxID=201089 RepID=A0A445MWP2_9BACT|nr:dTDP-4-dehydrorhamnose reductase [uncultured Desulfobacterium sp.]
MKIFVIGSKGQLGWELCRRGKDRGFDILGLDLPEFDITHPSQVQSQVNGKGIFLVINASAYTAVDQAETQEELAFKVNCDGPAYLASSCARAKVPLFHISTDYVFDGTKKTPYKETDPVCPLGVYGKSKADGDERVRTLLKEHIIIRTAWLYGVHGNNFVRTMLRLGRAQEELRVVCDQYGCPTFAGDLADALLTLAGSLIKGEDIAWGTYHFCGKGATTWHGFAKMIFELAGKHTSLRLKELHAITADQYPMPAKRPVMSALDCSLIEKRFGISPRPWQEVLKNIMPHLLSDDH